MSDPAGGARRSTRLLDAIERIGNRLPAPATLFGIGAVLVMVLSQVAASLDWTVEKTISREVTQAVLDSAGQPLLDASGTPITHAVVDPATGSPQRELAVVEVRAVSLLTSEGIYWALRSMVTNFTAFPPLGVVLTGMLGIGAGREAPGLIGALAQGDHCWSVPGADAHADRWCFDGHPVVARPGRGLRGAAARWPRRSTQSVGRSPLVGIAAVFAGVSAGFSANLFLPTSLDPMLLALFHHRRARISSTPVTRSRRPANWWFMIASTVLLTFVGWGVTAWWVEPRFSRPSRGARAGRSRHPPASSPATPHARSGDQRVLILAVAAGAAGAHRHGVRIALALPGAPLYGIDGQVPALGEGHRAADLLSPSCSRVSSTA